MPHLQRRETTEVFKHPGLPAEVTGKCPFAMEAAVTFEDLRSLAAGFQPAKLLMTALDLGVFDILARGPATAEEVAAALGLDARATEIASNALVALGVLELRAGRYRNTPAAAEMLVRGSDGYRGEILRHLHRTWDNWSGLADAWRTGRSGRSTGLPLDEQAVRHFILGMENLTRDLAPRLADLLPLDGCRRALDLGAGPGNYALAFVRRVPGLEVVHFDLPATSRVARGFLAGRDGADRISFVEGSFLEDPLGEGYDFVWISQVLHMLGEGPAADLVRRASDALAGGGTLAIHDHFLEPDRTGPQPAALFGVHMLVASEGGRAYAFEEMEAWLRKAGIEPVERIAYGGPHRILVGRKTGSGGRAAARPPERPVSRNSPKRTPARPGNPS